MMLLQLPGEVERDPLAVDKAAQRQLQQPHCGELLAIDYFVSAVATAACKLPRANNLITRRQLQQQLWRELRAVDRLLHGSCNSSIGVSFWLLIEFSKAVATAALERASGCCSTNLCRESMTESPWLRIRLLQGSCNSSIGGSLWLFMTFLLPEDFCC